PRHVGEVVVAGAAGLHGFAHRDVDAGQPRMTGQRRGRHRLADAGVGAGDDEDTHLRTASTSVSTSRARAISSSDNDARAVSRSRAVRAGTFGGRKQPTRTPRSRHAAAAASATSGSPRMTDTTADSGRSVT